MTVAEIANYASWALLLGGSFFLLVGGIGVLRLPDVYARLHAAGVTDTLGTFLILAGLGIQAGFSLISFKLLLILAFMWMTSPVASHALAQASLYAGRKPQLKANHVSKQSAAAFSLPAVEPGEKAED
ncbi:MAG: monovalent cation/H(+) antiporter subunit G [Alphaproteobacteria bacterium]